MFLLFRFMLLQGGSIPKIRGVGWVGKWEKRSENPTKKSRLKLPQVWSYGRTWLTFGSSLLVSQVYLPRLATSLKWQDFNTLQNLHIYHSTFRSGRQVGFCLESLRRQNDFSKRKVISACDAQKFKKLVTPSTPEKSFKNPTIADFKVGTGGTWV